MSRGVYIFSFIVNSELWQFNVRQSKLIQSFSGCKVGGFSLRVSDRPAKASSDNVSGKAGLSCGREQGALGTPDIHVLSPPKGFSYPERFWSDRKPRKWEAVSHFLQRSHSVINTWQRDRLENRHDRTLNSGMWGCAILFSTVEFLD